MPRRRRSPRWSKRSRPTRNASCRALRGCREGTAAPGARADPRSQAVGGRAGGAQEIGRCGEGDDGGGETMTTSLRDLQERGIGATLRGDAWWVAPALTALVLGSFGIYATWAAWTGAHYEWGPYLSPFYSPLLRPSWWPLSPAFWILPCPRGSRLTWHCCRTAHSPPGLPDPLP